MKFKSIKGMILLGILAFILGVIFIIPHVTIDSVSNFASQNLEPFMWSLVFVCGGIALVHAYITSQQAKTWLMSIIFTIIALAVIHVQESLLLKNEINKQQLEIAQRAAGFRSQIESVINADLYLTGSVINQLRDRQYGVTQEEFSDYAKVIVNTSPRIRHIAMAKDLIVSHVYPLEGNEKALGLNYRENPQQLPMVQKAITENKVILTGPVNLVQGGTALIGRIPLTITSDVPEAADVTWGVMSIIIDTNAMFSELQADTTDLAITIRGSDALGQEGGIIFGESATFDLMPLLFTIELPHGEWQMAIAPATGWTDVIPNKVPMRIAIILILIIMIFFTLIRAGHQKETRKSIVNLQTQLDDSERRTAEIEKESKSEIQARKLEAIGQLTGGIAHDFNNILAAINGYAELSQMTLKSGMNPDKLNANLKEIIKAGNRAKALVGQMLTFSRGKEIKSEVIEPMVVLQETLQMMHAMLPTSITLHTDYNDFDSRIKIDPVQLQQILINLVVNARDAIPRTQGNITIGSKLLESYFGSCSSCNETIVGDYLCISITDDGQGIPPDQLNKIFDPFFTTKAVGKGTGMGLSVVHGIIHGVEGHIIINSQLNRGTTIELLFKVTNEPLPTDLSSNPITTVETKESEKTRRILVIDDEEPITQLYEDVFEADGITAIIFNDPKLALDYFLQNQDEIAVIVTDYTMPGLNGTDLIKAIRRQNDEVAIILCSGNADALDREVFEEIGVTHFLSKPVNLIQMSNLVSSYL